MEHRQAVDTLASERYLLGEMTDAERDAFEAHFFSCHECAEDIRAAAMMRDGVRAGFLRPQTSVRRWRPAIVLPWAAAATLAVALGYQTARTRPAGSLAVGPLSLAPVTLRSSTRGQDVSVAPGPGDVVTLALDLGGERFAGDIQYELRRADGDTLASGHATPPAPGAPLLLVIPGRLVKISGRYVLSIRDISNVGLTPEEYRFSVDAR
jgi:hypothetical protein